MPADIQRPSAELIRLFQGVSSASASGDLRHLGFNINTVGVILMVVGVVGLVLGLYLLMRGRWATPSPPELP